ncbi:pali-domain-containing protein [Schizopora paradoxa]|uniref:Pali-domain-containing protein n=1 Tax=Schizopora paradoxa TaxID=27342 RepID=A0A0H2R472_9AGAM|nr:pali-domain-containing protein [Schizopora paradoxa]
MSFAAATGLFCTLVALVLLIVVSVSVPRVDDISFLKFEPVLNSAQTIRFGVFGYTGSDTSVGYHFPEFAVSDSSPFTGNYFHVLTGFLILHPIAAGLCALSFVFGICGLSNCIAEVFMTVVNAVSCIVTFVALCIDLGFWTYVRHKLHEEGIPAELSNCIWLTLAAFIVLLLGIIFGACGSVAVCFGRVSDRVRRR